MSGRRGGRGSNRGRINNNNNNNNYSGRGNQSRGVRDERLSMNAVTRNSSEFSNNFYPWFRKWEIKSGTYGDEIKKQFKAGEATAYDLESHRREFPITPLLCVDTKIFRYTAEQIQLLEQLIVQEGGEEK
jgi:hypothetical protein